MIFEEAARWALSPRIVLDRIVNWPYEELADEWYLINEIKRLRAELATEKEREFQRCRDIVAGSYMKLTDNDPTDSDIAHNQAVSGILAKLSLAGDTDWYCLPITLKTEFDRLKALSSEQTQEISRLRLELEDAAAIRASNAAPPQPEVEAVAELKRHIKEAEDKFYVLSFYINDPVANKCALDKCNQMRRALGKVPMDFGPDMVRPRNAAPPHVEPSAADPRIEAVVRRFPNEIDATDAASILAAADAAAREAGWVLVPVVPTRKMQLAGLHCSDDAAALCWDAMRAAASSEDPHPMTRLATLPKEPTP